MGKCASKEIVGGHAVPDMDAASPMFAPSAAPGLNEEAGAEHTSAAPENAVTFSGYAPAPVDPVASALPVDHQDGYGGAVPAGAYGSGYAHDGYKPEPAPYGGYKSEPIDGYRQPKTERVDLSYGQSAAPFFNTLEEAEEHARKANEKAGVDHIPYKQGNYGTTYADQARAIPSYGYQASPAYNTRPAAYNDQQPRGYDERHSAPAEPSRPAYDDQQPRGYEERREEQRYEEPRYEERREEPRYDEPREAAAEEPRPAEVDSPSAGPVASPETAPVTAPEEPIAPKKEKAKKKKSSKKKNSWAW